MGGQIDLENYLSKSKRFKSLIVEIEQKHNKWFAKRGKLQTCYFITEDKGKIEIAFIPKSKVPKHIKKEVLDSFNKVFD